jgi:uncharacterized protein YegP (UPF0339 family)
VKKLIAVVTLTGLFAAGTFTALAYAQGTKPTAAATKPADPKPTGKADPKPDPKAAVKGSVVIKPDVKGKFRVSIRDEDGKTLLMSSTGFIFDTEKEAIAAIDEIKSILATSKVTVEKAEEKKDK